MMQQHPSAYLPQQGQHVCFYQVNAPASCITSPGTTGIPREMPSTFIDGVHIQGVFSSPYLFNLLPSFQIEAPSTEE